MRPRTSLPCLGFCFSICSIAYLQPKNIPFAPTAITRSHSSSVVSNSAARPCAAALFTIISRQPYFFTVLATSFFTSLSSVTSVFINVESPLEFIIASTVFSPPSSGSSRISATTTFAPSLAALVEIDFPIPDAPPVTIKTLSFKRMLVFFAVGN